MLGTIKLRVHLGHTNINIKFIVCETLAAPAIIGKDFCDQHVKAKRPKQRLEELKSGNCLSFMWKPRERTKSQPPLREGLTYTINHSRSSLIVRVVEKTILSPPSQTWVSVQSPWAGTATLQSYSPLYEKCSTVAANGDVRVKPNLPFKILIANMGTIV